MIRSNRDSRKISGDRRRI